MKRRGSYLCSSSGPCWQTSHHNDLVFECSEQDLVTSVKMMVQMVIKLYIVETLCLTIRHCLHSVQAAIFCCF